MNNESKVKVLADKWYKKIRFPAEYDEEFKELISAISDPGEMLFTDYDFEANKDDNQKNLIMYLYFCEELSRKYEEKGIPEEILMASLVPDFPIMVKRCVCLTGKLGLLRAGWFNLHMNLKLYRLGRLQFCMHTCYEDVPSKGLKKGDPVMDVHIPGEGPLDVDECQKSFDLCEKFFKKFFPDFKWDYYTCFSWVFDDVLENFLKEDSNILKFGKLFEPVHSVPADSILHFMFKYGIESRDEIKDIPAKSSFAQKVKDYALSGGEFKNVLAVKKR